MARLRSRISCLALVLGAPMGVIAQKTRAAATPSGAVEEFMHAVADSNLTRMAELWGNAKGPASQTHSPRNYQKQIIIMQAFLHGVQARALGDVPANKGDMRTVTTQLAHNGCTVTIPINVVKAKQGWLVHDFDLAQAGQINHPCENEKRPGNPGS